MKQIVWSLKIRLLHWLMASFIIINLFIFDEGEEIHVWLGYGTLAIVLLRTIIGFTSEGFESFKKFPLKPSKLVSFLKNMFKRTGQDYAGHNPAASYAYIAFWLLVVILGVTGILLVHVDAFWGDQLVEEIHEISANAVIVFLVIHFTGILLDSIIHKRKAWMSMLTGKK